jgi:1,4-alpha-glucan branching enzyme
MNNLDAKYNWLSSSQAYVSLKHEGDKIIAYERAGLLFVFNFHPTKSFTDYRIGVDVAGTYKVALSSDDKQYGGFENVDTTTLFKTTPEEWTGRRNHLQASPASSISEKSDVANGDFLQLYIPSRTVQVLALAK